ncbi:MAG TPA: type II toxin-antitoxin system Phd/YefM family antitoxin [Sporichthyaceae bacterium]|jgi:prevent-host-death family protein|nr:type II toxin-antitoxin system Phd/YefM family antitoxin [Sporichthyaceae bacterium]
MSSQPLAEVKANLSRYVEAAEREHERITITKNGRPAAVLISVADLETLEETLSVLSDPAAMRELAEADEAWGRGEYTTAQDMSAVLAARRRAELG